VSVDEETGTLVWPKDVDLDPDVIYAANGQETMSPSSSRHDHVPTPGDRGA